MSIRKVVVHFADGGAASRHALTVAAALARRHAALLSVHAVAPAPSEGAYLNPETAALAAQVQEELLRALKDQASAAVQELAPGLELELVVRAQNPAQHFAQAGRVADLLVLGQVEPGVGLGLEAQGHILVQSACPVLVVPHIGAPPTLGESPVLAWSGSRESARALQASLPWLPWVKKLELLTLSNELPSGWNDALALLRRHGAPVEPCHLKPSTPPSLGERLARAWSPDASTAETLLSHVADSGADLIVCGAYGHPRAWELVLGGVTRELLHSMTVPVLFSH
ncbi:nucleotide-binding universal stress UspA family protein [Inhella inkyongensis]|uniref:Nucleotide-binding universal stress UspA family protein n=1 Tax=Inhella inkyongensis TaxID=392593 RepID=A0A840S6A5_9BURK|nr:universal stress protein [Inhella inkyongensis]MBB5205048.1 nucleotide-binding universal stress UspA family protein [Inhella inkyongensis]